MPQISVTMSIGENALPATERAVVTAIRQLHTTLPRDININFSVSRDERLRMLRAQTQVNDAALTEYRGSLVGTAVPGVRSAHGVTSMVCQAAGLNTTYRVTFSGRHKAADYYMRITQNLDHRKIKLVWLDLCEESSTTHASGGTSTMMGFSGTSGARVLYYFPYDLLIYTPDHYQTYQLVVTQAGTPAHTL